MPTYKEKVQSLYTGSGKVLRSLDDEGDRKTIAKRQAEEELRKRMAELEAKERRERLGPSEFGARISDVILKRKR